MWKLDFKKDMKLKVGLPGGGRTSGKGRETREGDEEVSMIEIHSIRI
jgi:hypothetical protein